MEMQQKQSEISQGPVQGLKSERVQEEVALAEEPFRISLKAERVQEPAALLADAEGKVSSVYELSFNQMRDVVIELDEPQIAIALVATGGPKSA